MKKVAAISAIALAMGMGSAFAADLPSRKAPVYVPPPPPPLVWNGFYAGLNIGGGWNANNPDNEGSIFFDPNYAFGAAGIAPAFGTPNVFFLPNNNRTGSEGGVVGGGQVGYNFQFNPSIVIGAEADIQGSSIGGNGPGNNFNFFPSPFFTPGTVVFNDVLVPISPINGGRLGIDWIGTVRGRAGWLFTPSLLVYGTAGFAYAGVSDWGLRDTRTGWTAGGGVEWMFAPRWSAKLEYLFVDLSNNNNNWGGFGWNWGWNFRPQVNIVRAGVNYHFNWAAPAPVLAKY